ncbi:hypothetical protein pb186bvf_017430 [Paramecium bursaria]
MKDIFSDDNAYREFQRIKEDQEREKQARIEKVLDEYCYQQLNLPASEYRSQMTDLLYRPKYYPVNVVHPLRDQHNSQFIGFNQTSGPIKRNQRQLRQYPQQYHYENPFINNGQNSISSIGQTLPSLSLPQGNLAYGRYPMEQQNPYPQYSQSKV